MFLMIFEILWGNKQMNIHIGQIENPFFFLVDYKNVCFALIMFPLSPSINNHKKRIARNEYGWSKSFNAYRSSE